jgi:predicted HAD superfamily phosphohydrolase
MPCVDINGNSYSLHNLNVTIITPQSRKLGKISKIKNVVMNLNPLYPRIPICIAQK